MTELKQKYDAPTVAVMRQALNDVVADRRFLARRSRRLKWRSTSFTRRHLANATSTA